MGMSDIWPADILRTDAVLISIAYLWRVISVPKSIIQGRLNRTVMEGHHHCVTSSTRSADHHMVRGAA